MKITNEKKYIIHKFGGSSLANVDRFKAIKSILEGKNEIIVVSAIKDVTTNLQKALDKSRKSEDYHSDLIDLKNIHIEIIKSLISEEFQNEILLIIEKDFLELKNIMQVVTQISSYSKEIQDFVLGYGEQWSARILSRYLACSFKTIFLDASHVLITNLNNNIISIDWDKSKELLNNFIKKNEFEQIVVTGFIASTQEGKKTTLGRNGSDFSGAAFAKLFQAKSLCIWKDVEGIYSANPSKVPAAFPIESLSYQEALELAYFGAKVLHPRTIAPAKEENIPIYIKSSFYPNAQGTIISNSPEESPLSIKGVTSIDDVALINIEGAGMIGVSGIAARIFSIIHQKNISVILISQASSEYSICFAVSQEHAEITLNTLNEHLYAEIEKRQIDKIFVEKECSILAIVGDGMIGKVGISGKLFACLAKANVNIRAIAQGSSERNISVVINKKNTSKALKVVHSSFYLSHKTISIGLIGLGSVGSAFLEQINTASEKLKLKYNVHFAVRGIMNSKKMLLSQDALDLKNHREELNKSPVIADIKKFSEHIASDDIPHAVIIDCTADKNVANKYLDFIKNGIHIITPNKHANGGDLDFYKELKALAQQKNCQYYYEATVCAGLPVINTLQDIIKSGDEVISIEGIVSGTLSYIFNELSRGKLFSEAVIAAKKQGFTEPDPRIDLSGQDVARKLICLAREIGHDISLQNIKVHDLVPEELKTCSVNDFLERLSGYDKQMSHFVSDANAKNERICYVGSINKEGIVHIKIQSFPQNHPFSRLQGTDNMLIFYTQRYRNQPLIIQGPGAGAEVTAAGIFADLLRLASSLQ